MAFSTWHRRIALIGLVLAGFSTVACAAGEEQKIRAAIAQAVPGTPIISVRPSPMPGVFAVETQGGIVYASGDGQYIIQGDLMQLKGKDVVNLTEQANAVKRVAVLNGIDRRDEIIYLAKNGGKPKAVLTVFTDVDCGYCRKLHQEVPAMNRLGIEVRYLAWPRDLPRVGPNAGAGLVMNQVWCSTDRERALTLAKQGQPLPPAKAGCKAPIAEQFALGQTLGVRGTPAVFTAKGEMIGGYLTAQQAAQALGIN